MIQSAQQARNTQVFVIDYNGRIQETNLYDHVEVSAEKTTSPRGVMYKMFFEEYMFEADEADEAPFEWSPYVLKMWGSGGRGPADVLAIFDTKEEAEDEWFRRTYEYDFLPDDQRNTAYYSSREEAIEGLAMLIGRKPEVMARYLRMTQK